MENKNKKIKILVTGCVGFIGFHVCNFLTNKGFHVIGIDNINTYYDIKLKKDRLKILNLRKNFNFHKVDISDSLKLKKVFKKEKFEYVPHVRTRPRGYELLLLIQRKVFFLINWIM